VECENSPEYSAGSSKYVTRENLGRRSLKVEKAHVFRLVPSAIGISLENASTLRVEMVN